MNLSDLNTSEDQVKTSSAPQDLPQPFDSYVYEDLEILESELQVKVSVDGDKRNTYRYYLPFMAITEEQLDLFLAELELLIGEITVGGIVLKYTDK